MRAGPEMTPGHSTLGPGRAPPQERGFPGRPEAQETGPWVRAQGPHCCQSARRWRRGPPQSL